MNREPKTSNNVLARQLKRYFGRIEAVPGNLAGFMDSVNETYRCFDDDRKMLEPSMELSSQELLQANSECGRSCMPSRTCSSDCGPTEHWNVKPTSTPLLYAL